MPRAARLAAGALLLLPGLALAGALGGAGVPEGLRKAPDAREPRLHMATFMNSMDRRFAFLQVSAEDQGIYPQVVGYGTKAWHPDGLGVKINSLRSFVYASVADDDILVFADAFDVLVVGDREEITTRFQEMERRSGISLVFNAEEVCYPPQLDRTGMFDICDQALYPPSPHRWRFLNSGLIVGRGHAFKDMLREPAPEVIPGGDQAWYQQWRWDHPEKALLDQRCELACAVWSVHGPADNAELRAGRVYVKSTGTRPPLLHFVSVGHWTRWDRPGRQGTASTLLHDVFRELFPTRSAKLVDGWWFGVLVGSTHILEFYKGGGWWLTMRSFLCVHCNLLGSQHGECEFFPAFSAQCMLVNGAVLLAAAASLWLLARCCRGAQALPAGPGDAPQQLPGLQAAARRELRRFGFTTFGKAPELDF